MKMHVSEPVMSQRLLHMDCRRRGAQTDKPDPSSGKAYTLKGKEIHTSDHSKVTLVCGLQSLSPVKCSCYISHAPSVKHLTDFNRLFAHLSPFSTLNSFKGRDLICSSVNPSQTHRSSENVCKVNE